MRDRCPIVLALTVGMWMALAHSARAGQEAPAETRAEALLAERQARLAEVEPAKDSAIVRMLTTIENDGFDQVVTVQAGHFRFGYGQISPASGGAPAIQYERPRLGATPLTLRTAAAYSLRGYQAYELQLGVFDTPAPKPFAGDGFLGAPFDFDNRSVAPLDELLYRGRPLPAVPKGGILRGGARLEQRRPQHLCDRGERCGPGRRVSAGSLAGGVRPCRPRAVRPRRG